MKKNIKLLVFLLLAGMGCNLWAASWEPGNEPIAEEEEWNKIIQQQPLASFVINAFKKSDNPKLESFGTVISNFLNKRSSKRVNIEDFPIAHYFVTLLRNQKPFETAAVDLYSPAMQSKLQKEVFGRQTWGQWATSFFKTQKNVYCQIFEEYVKPLLIRVFIDGVPEDQQLQSDFQHFLSQLFILAQQDATGACWDEAITSIRQTSYRGQDQNTKLYLLKTMAESALISYTTLYQTNQEAANEGLKGKYQQFMSLMKSWRYLYFLVTSAQALKAINENSFDGFMQNIGQKLLDAGINDKTERDTLVSSLTIAINTPNFIQRSKTYLARAQKTLAAFKYIGLTTAGIVTLSWTYNQIQKNFGTIRSSRIWNAIGAETMLNTISQKTSDIKQAGLKRFQRLKTRYGY